MLRSEFSQKVVRDILSGKVHDLLSYAMAVPVRLWGGETSKQRYEIAHDLIICPGDPVNKPMDEREAFTQLKEFVALWDYLEQLGVIRGTQIRQPPVRRLTIFGAEDAPHYTIMSLIYPYVNKHIIVLPGLSEFVERGFLSEEEFFHQKETEDREAALRLTRRVAYITLAVSMVIAVFTNLFGYFASTRQQMQILRAETIPFLDFHGFEVVQFDTGKHVVVKFLLENTGKVPALGIVLGATARFERDQLYWRSAPDTVTTIVGDFLTPNGMIEVSSVSSFLLPVDYFNEVFNGARYVESGVVRYWDAFGHQDSATYCFQLRVGLDKKIGVWDCKSKFGDERTLRN